MERPSLLRAILGGFVATLTTTLIVFSLFHNQEFPANFFAVIGETFGPDKTTVSTVSKWWGIVWHFNFGTILFPFLYFMGAYPILRGKPWEKGVQWGVLLWLFAMAIGLPLFGLGAFGGKTVAPFELSIGLLALHLIYGIVFATITGKRVKEFKFIEQEEKEAA